MLDSWICDEGPKVNIHWVDVVYMNMADAFNDSLDMVKCVRCIDNSLNYLCIEHISPYQENHSNHQPNFILTRSIGTHFVCHTISAGLV